MIPRQAYVALAIVVGLFALYRYGHHVGWSERDAEMQQAIAVANEKSRETEQRLNAEINDVNNTLTKANEALEKESSALDRAIRAGRVRLPSSSCVSTSSGPATPSGAGNETTSESDRETLQLIAQIAADGDRAINQLNACIDAYNQVRERINGQR